MLSQDEYWALRQLTPSELEELICGIREDRWAEFRDSHRVLLWITGIAAVSVVLALAAPIFGFVAFCAWVCVMSLGFSAISRALALGRECRFFRRAHEVATQSPTYDGFREVYLGKIAAFQILRRDTYHYAIELSGNPILEKQAAENTFIVLGWPAEWNASNELVHYPDARPKHDAAEAISICVHSTNLVRIRLIHTSASLKFERGTKDSQEKRINMFEESFQREFKKFGFILRNDGDETWAALAPHVALSPYWSRDGSGAVSLEHRPTSKSDVASES